MELRTQVSRVFMWMEHITMAHDEKYRARAVSFKDAGHSFDELRETFGVYRAQESNFTNTEILSCLSFDMSCRMVK